MSFAATTDNTAFIAPLGGRETDPEAGAARRGFFARAWSATKGMAKAAFTKENAKNMAFGAGTMFVLKSSAAAIAAAYALPAAAATASVLGVGAAGAAGLSYYRERSAAKREGRAADGFFSDANLRRMSLAAGISVVGGSLVAAYQGGMFAPITDKLAELAKHIHLPEVHFNLSPISDAQAYDYSPGGEMDQMSGHGAVTVASPPHPEAAASAAHPVDAVAAEKPAPAMDKASAGVERAAAPVEAPSAHPAPHSHPATDVASVPTTGGGSALGQVQEMIAQHGGKPSRSMEMLLDRAAHSAQGEKDLAVAILWGKGGFTANPELARTLLEDAVKQGNRQAATSLAWMDKHGLGLSSSSHAPVVTEAHASAPAHPAAPVAETTPPREAAACVMQGDLDKGPYRLQCTFDEKADAVQPGEHITVMDPAFPKVEIQIRNGSNEPWDMGRVLTKRVYDGARALREQFTLAAGNMEPGKILEKVKLAMAKPLDFGFGNM